MSQGDPPADGGQQWQERDRHAVWHALAGHNTRSSHLLMAAGDGAWVTDVDGRRYLDGMSGQWCVNAGYGREELARAAYEQMRALAFYPMVQGHRPAIELAERISEWLGGDYVVFFASSGSEANEVAFKVARQYHRQTGAPNRWKFISRYRNFHGITFGALAATGQSQRKHLYEPLTPGFVHVAQPDRYRCGYCSRASACNTQCSQELARTINAEVAESVAGVIIEAVTTGGGVIVPPEGYVEAVAETCAASGALLIVDEVICGFGRTGARFGFHHHPVLPDIVTMAKGLTSGYFPLAATAVRRELFEAFDGTDEYGRLRHVGTYGGHPVGCAVALRNLEILERENLATRAAAVGSALLERLRCLTRHPVVGDVRGHGLLLGVELVVDRDSRVPATPEVVDRVLADCRGRGLILFKNGDTVPGHENIIVMAPPLIITDEDVEFIAVVLDDVLAGIDQRQMSALPMCSDSAGAQIDPRH